MMLFHQLAAALIPQAAAPPAAAPVGPLGGIAPLVPFALMFVIVYFLLLRPVGKQRKAQQQLIHALKKDDEVVTSAGIYGRIVAIEDKVVTLEIADKVKIRMLRDRIAGLWDSNGPSGSSAQTALSDKRAKSNKTSGV